jgi:hypothetical protein
MVLFPCAFLNALALLQFSNSGITVGLRCRLINIIDDYILIEQIE